MPEQTPESVGKLSQRLSGRLRAVSSVLQENRKHRRIAVPLVVKMLMDDGTEEEAIVRDISAGGASILSENKPPNGSRVILYIRDVGRLECSVVREHPHGFAVDFYCSKSRRDKIAPGACRRCPDAGRYLGRTRGLDPFQWRDHGLPYCRPVAERRVGTSGAATVHWVRGRAGPHARHGHAPHAGRRGH